MQSTSWQLTSIALCVFSAAIQLAGVVSPMWKWVVDSADDSNYVGVGLFNRVGLDEADGEVIPDNIKTFGVSDALTVDTDHWLIVTILVLVALGLTAVLIVLIVFHYIMFVANKGTRCLYILTFSTVALSWMSNASGLLVYAIYEGSFLIAGPKLENFTFCWSGVICAASLLINVAINLIVAFHFQPESIVVIPAGADPNINQFPSTQTGLMSRYYQPDGLNSLSKAHKGANENGGFDANANNNNNSNNNGNNFNNYFNNNDVAQTRGANFGQGYNNNNNNDNNNNHHNEKRMSGGFSYEQGGMSNGGGISFIQNHQQSIQQQPQVLNLQPPMPQQTGQIFDSSPYGNNNLEFYDRRNSEIWGTATTTKLERGNSRKRLTEEVVFNQQMPPTQQFQQPQQLIQETPLNRDVRRKSKDFLVSAKHGADRDAHRGVEKYLSHTKQPDNENNRGQRLALSPLNFADGSNTKYNPSFIYRPYSEQAY